MGLGQQVTELPLGRGIWSNRRGVPVARPRTNVKEVGHSTYNQKGHTPAEGWVSG